MEEKDLATLLTTYGVMLMAYSAWGYPLLQRVSAFSSNRCAASL